MENTFATHILDRKFAVLDRLNFTEVKGIVAFNDTNGDIFLSPDPNYYNLLLGGNVVAPGSGDRNAAGSTYPRWKEFQNNLGNCTLPPLVYKKPFPIMRLELYGFDGENAGPNRPRDAPFLPKVNDSGTIRHVQICDHISLRGLYVIDHGHTMYQGDGMTPAFCYIEDLDDFPLFQRICKPHAEIHPYQWHSVALVKPLPARILRENNETHTVVVPFYKEFYGEDFHPSRGWDCTYPSSGGKCTQVVDSSRQNELSVHWWIEAPPYPTGSQCRLMGGNDCEMKFREDVISRTGKVSAVITPESDPSFPPNGIHVHVNATALAESHYYPVPPGGCLRHPQLENIGCSYRLVYPSQYIARYSVWWVPAGPPPPPQEQQLPK